MAELKNPSEEPAVEPVLDFTDRKNRKWTLSIDLGLARKLKKDAACDLFSTVTHDYLRELAMNPQYLGEVLWVICEGQATERGVDSDDFVSGFNGQVIGEAVDVLMNAIVDFFRFSPSQGAQMQAARTMVQKLEVEASAMVNQKMNSAEMDEVIHRTIEQAGKQLTESLDSLESASPTPTV